METPKFEKKSDVEQKEKEITIELDEETIKDISSTKRGSEFLRKVRRVTAIGGIVILSTVATVFAQEKPSQDVDMKAVKKELIKTAGREHKDAAISKIYDVPGEKDPAYLIQEDGRYKLVVPATEKSYSMATETALFNASELLGGGITEGGKGVRVESRKLRENKKEGTTTHFVTIVFDEVTVDGKPAIEILLK